MRKYLSVLLMVLLVLVLFTACSGDDEAGKSNDVNENTNEGGEDNDNNNNNDDSNNDNESANNNNNNESDNNLSSDELVKAAQEEGKVVVYSVSSRIANAGELFEKKYGIEVESYNLGDSELIEKVSQESRSGISNADFVVAQESGRVLGELIEPGYLENYVPESMKDVIPEEYQDPLVFFNVTKLFTYNSETYNFPPVNNIWELTEPEWSGLSYMKDPFQEGVNVSFFTMLTSPEVSEEIAQAYERHYGKEIELTTENAGYEWIKAFFDNDVVLFNSDTTVNEAVGIKDNDIEAVGLYAYSKLKSRETKDLAVMPMMSMDPFVGFYYPMLMLPVTDSEHPNAAKLFIDFLFTEEGFSPWSGEVEVGLGNYSSNPNIPSGLGDLPFSLWSQILVREDPDFTFNSRSKVEDFLNDVIY